MALQEVRASERVVAARERYVARGISTPTLVVDRAEGARVWDVDGREYVDFAGGLGCQNTGHGLPAAVAAIHEQVDRYLHQCFMVGMYEPYIEVCRRLAELSPCAGDEQRSILVNSGAEAIENAVKIARAATGRPAVVVFDHAFHGRTLLTMTMTSKVAYKRGFGPFAPEVYRAPGALPVPRRRHRGGDRGPRAPLRARGRPGERRLRRARADPGRRRVHRDARRLPARAQGGLRAARDPLRRRRGADGRRAHRAGLGDRALRRSSRTCWSPASRSAAGCRSRA